MEKEQAFEYGADMIYLAACALHGRVPDEQAVKKMNLAGVARLAKWHSMQAITYMALSPFGEALDSDGRDVLLSLKRAYAKVLRRLVLFDIERERLTDFLRNNGIWYSLLKGTVLQYYYPKLGMRQMADNDILVDPSGCEAIRSYMEQNGYRTENYGKGCHDTYLKDTLNFEIHRRLVADTKKNAVYSDYFDKTYTRFLPSETLERRLSDEDFYVYFIYHAYKHFSQGGTGVRTLMDIFVFKARCGAALDTAYVDRELSALGLSDFERRASVLAEKLFSGQCLYPNTEGLLTDAEREELLYYVSSGTFGTVTNMVENSLEQISGGNKISLKTKIVYILGRIFPPYDHYRAQFPKASRFVITLPVLWFIRLCGAIFSPKRFSAELRELGKAKGDK